MRASALTLFLFWALRDRGHEANLRYLGILHKNRLKICLTFVQYFLLKPLTFGCPCVILSLSRGRSPLGEAGRGKPPQQTAGQGVWGVTDGVQEHAGWRAVFNARLVRKRWQSRNPAPRTPAVGIQRGAFCGSVNRTTPRRAVCRTHTRYPSSESEGAKGGERPTIK